MTEDKQQENQAQEYDASQIQVSSQSLYIFKYNEIMSRYILIHRV